MAGRSKNLLKNPCGKGGLDHWEVLCSGGDGFTVEESPCGCKQLSECCPSVKGEKCCWATSHDPCEKLQLVDLVDAGCKPDKLDEKKPPITVRDWYGARGDCGCNYRLTARLLNGDKEELDKWEFNDTKEEGQDWAKAKHIFKDYPSGVRYVEFKHGGEDTKNWAGHYGVKMTMSAVFVGQKRKKRAKRAVKAACSRNLLKNPCAKEDMNGWLTTEGGDGFKVEGESCGCKDLKDFNGDAEDSCCWATSYGACEKTQTVDLGFEGLDGALMDEVQPEIKVAEWFGCRNDAGCVYWLRVRLLNSDMDEIDKKEIREERDASGDWFHVSESFSGYGPGVRFVEYTHGGQDNCNWAGHYGAKISCSSLVVCLPEKPADKSSSSSSSSSDEES